MSKKFLVNLFEVAMIDLPISESKSVTDAYINAVVNVLKELDSSETIDNFYMLERLSDDYKKQCDDFFLDKLSKDK